MKNYISSLGLRSDPFDSIAGTSDYFAGAGRGELLEQLLQLSRCSQDILVVTGPLGSGKSTVGEWFIKGLGRETLTACIEATLFMSSLRLLEQLAFALDRRTTHADTETALKDHISTRLAQFAEEGKICHLVVDDAHELGDDALRLLLELARNPEFSTSVRLLLLGEMQLLKMLEKLLPFSREIVAFSNFDLEALGIQQTIEYVLFRLRSAGFKGLLPLESDAIGKIQNQSGGNPGLINALVRDRLELVQVNHSLGRMDSPSTYYTTALILMAAMLGVAVLTGENYLTPARDELLPDRVQIQIPISGGSSNLPAAVGAGLASTSKEFDLPDLESHQLQEVLVKETEEERILVATPDPVIEMPISDLGIVAAQAPLLNRPSQSFTLQILGSQSEDSVKQFISAQDNPQEFIYFETRRLDRPWFVVLFGDYPDRHMATAAIELLPEHLRNQQPWPRSLSAIQADIHKINQ